MKKLDCVISGRCKNEDEKIFKEEENIENIIENIFENLIENI